MTEIKGWHVFAGFAGAFSVIIAVNLTLAFNAVKTFPGLEVKNSYVASQSFDADRAAQHALNWTVSADVRDNVLNLQILQGDQPVAPEIVSAVFGRATNVSQDQEPKFTFQNGMLRAPVQADNGNWNLRLKARAADGTVFQQRIIVGTTK